MRVELVTSFSPEGADLYGRQCVESATQHWQNVRNCGWNWHKHRILSQMKKKKLIACGNWSTTSIKIKA